jgi:outer membrane receptor protein involved in Fe transport
MAVARSFAQRIRHTLPLFLLAAFIGSSFVLQVSADEPEEDSSAATIQRRIASLFQASFEQPEVDPELEDDAELEDPDLSALSELESLLSEPVLVPGVSAATLTELVDDLPTQLPPGYVVAPVSRRTPAAVTRIDYEMIWASGARRMSELFDIYVPNTQIAKHGFQFDHIITRGLLGDLEDKYLFLVNGKIMNHQTIVGAFSEIRDLPLLGDIHHVDFVRGPGSAMWGPGAISGVVSVVTHNAMTFQGTDATIRQGELENFSALELRHGRKFTEDSGLFVYFGMADYDGANYTQAPLKFSKSFDTPDVLPNYVAGEPITVRPGIFANDQESWRSRPKMKLHTQYTKGNFDLWVRYTQGGGKGSPGRGNFALPPFGGQQPGQTYDSRRQFQFGYVQFTVFGQYKWEINDCLNAEFRMSWDTMDFSRGGPDGGNVPHREEEYYGRVMLNWTPNDSHSTAVGVEASHGRFGLKAMSFDRPPRTIINGTNVPWWTTGYAFIGEHQWRINDCWTLFLTGRWDQHSFTKTLFSPRGAIVWTPDEVNTLKFIATESVRRLPEDVLFDDFRNNRGRTDVEEIESLELRYERRHSDAWSWALGGFYQESKFVGLSGRGNSNQGQFADVDMWGAELELSYRTDRARIIASQSYTGLIHFDLVGPFALPDPFDLADPFFVQRISAAPYGFGNEMGSQSPHLTKIAIHYDHNCCWSSDASLRVYWGRPGDEDLAAFENARLEARGSANRVTDPGFFKAFRESVFLNYALNYRHNEHITARLDLYNILGWFDKDLNKRNFILGGIGSYRDEAAAIAASVRFKY